MNISDKTEIIFLRHGSTDYSKESRLYESDEHPSLNVDGISEMEKASEWLKKIKFIPDLTYSSRAVRAVQSAEIISNTLSLNFEILENIQERNAGIWGGLTFKEISEKFPDLYLKYLENPCKVQIEGQEDIIFFDNRVKKVFENINYKIRNKKILVITHAGVIKTAIGQALGIDIQNYDRIFVQTGSAAKIEYYKEWASLIFCGLVPY
jgi:broad specificity phosphatase PhoE